MSSRPKRGASARAPMAEPLAKRRLTKDPDAVEEQIAVIMKLRGKSVLTREERLDILRVYFGICRAWHEEQKRTGRPEKLDAVKKTSALLGRGTGLVSSTIKSWTDAAQAGDGAATAGLAAVVDPPGSRGNFKAKPARVSHTLSVYFRVRDFVRERLTNRERVTASQVLAFLLENDLLENPPKTVNGEVPKKEYDAALKALRRYLTRRGFVRGKKRGTVMFKAEHIAWRDRYVAAIKANRELPPQERLREVYLDESYIHEYSEHDPADPLDDKTPHKGERFCLLAAIQGHSLKMAELPGLVPGSVWISCPQRAKGKSDPHTGDYHKVLFNGASFVKWWKEQLLPNLHEPSIIIMDNASHHMVKPPGTPNLSGISKPDILKALDEYNIPYEKPRVVDGKKVRGINMHEAKELLMQVIADVQPEVVQLAEAAGHKVLFTPPHYSDLQPIELVWARIKGNIGRDYSAARSMADVRARLDAEFEALHTEQGKIAIRDIMRSVDRKIDKLWEEIEEAERRADAGEVDSDSECSEVNLDTEDDDEPPSSQAL